MKKILLAFTAFLLTYGVHAQCTPSFTAAMSPIGNNLLRAGFTNTSVITAPVGAVVLSYSMNFGDGSTAPYFLGTHNYTTPGTYNVKLVATKKDTVTNAIVCKDSVIVPVNVYYTPCASTFSSVTSNTTAGLVTITASTPAGTPNMHYFWNFGDGTSGTGSPVTHVYANAGGHSVTLTAVDSATMCSYTYTSSVVSYASACANHTAGFSHSISGTTVSFISWAQNFNNQVRTINWSFGDGTTATGGISVSHTYTPGTYYPSCTVNWQDSTNPSILLCTDTFTDTIVVVNPANYCAGHTSSSTHSVNTLTVYFTSTSPSFAGETATSYWVYGDGSGVYNNTGTPSFHNYLTAGTYNAKHWTIWTHAASPVYTCVDTDYFTVTTVPLNVISGYIYKDSIAYPSFDSFKVWLITYNSTTSTLAAADSTTGYGFHTASYSFINKPAGTYLVKAARLGGIPGSTGLIPTYHDSSVYWSAAQNIIHTGGTSYNNHIWMKSGTVTSGPGFISGNVNAGANKTTGTPIPNLLVMLRDAANKPVQMTYTDANGDFTFSNIPLSTYSVYPEQMNYITTPFNSIVLTSASHAKTGVNFGQTNTELKPKTTGIQTLRAEDAAALYPNPSTGVVSISWKNISGTVSVWVADVAGRKVYELPAANTAMPSKIDLSALQNGIYFIHIATANGTQTQKMTLLK